MTVPTIHLGKVVDVSAGQPAPKPNDFSDDGFPFIRAGSLEGLLSGQTENDCEKIDAETARRYRMRLYPKDTILFAKSGMSAKIGRVYRMRQPAYVVSHLAALAPIGKYEPSYLVHWLRAHPPSKLIKDEAYPSIRTSEVSSLEVPDLHIDEQRRIAATLDKADAIRRKRQQALTLAGDFLKSVFLEMFGDPSTNSKGWPVGSIRDLIVDAKYGTSQKADVEEGSYPVLRMGNLTYSGRIDTTDLKYLDLKDNEIEKYTVRRGDILFNRTNSRELVGKTAVVMANEVYAYAGYLVRARTNSRANPHYISAFLNSTFGKATLQGMCKSIIGMANINAQEFQNIRIPVPPVDLQNRFGAVLERTEVTRQLLMADLRHATDLFAALSQRAFAGNL